MTIFTGWILPASPQLGDEWQRGLAPNIITHTFDGTRWHATGPPDAFAGLLVAGGATDQHLAKRGVQAFNTQWVDATAGILAMHEQATAETEWTVVHGLRQRFVSVTVVPAIGGVWFGVPGTVIVPQIEFRSISTAVLTFVHPVQGTALVRR